MRDHPSLPNGFSGAASSRPGSDRRRLPRRNGVASHPVAELLEAQPPANLFPVFFTFFDSRFSFSDLPGFLAFGFCGDLSGIGPPRSRQGTPASVGAPGGRPARAESTDRAPSPGRSDGYRAPAPCRSRAVADSAAAAAHRLSSLDVRRVHAALWSISPRRN
jgi:hypothetical protein